MDWKPHVTVAAIAEQNGRFLLVEEETIDGVVLNQPAGHLEDRESLIDAVKRETLEETAWTFAPESVVGIHLWRKSETATFLRVCFSGICLEHHPELALDTGIIRSLWLSRKELASQRERLRSPLVLDTVDAYLAGTRYPLSLLKTLL